MRAALAAMLALGLALGACALGDDRPDRSCKGNDDCFAAQGEICNQTTKQCEQAPDAGALQAADEGVATEAEGDGAATATPDGPDDEVTP